MSVLDALTDLVFFQLHFVFFAGMALYYVNEFVFSISHRFRTAHRAGECYCHFQHLSL